MGVVVDDSPSPDFDSPAGGDDKVSRGQRVRTAPDRLRVTGRGQSYKSHQVQSVCQTSLTRVLGGGGGHQGDWALLGPVLGCAKPMYAQRGRLRRVKRLTQTDWED